MAAQSSLSATHWLASDIYEADVYDNAEDEIGVATDLILDSSGNVTTAVVGAGGFLGAGKKEVAVPFKDLKMVSREARIGWFLTKPKKSSRRPRPMIRKPTAQWDSKPEVRLQRQDYGGTTVAPGKLRAQGAAQRCRGFETKGVCNGLESH